MFLGIGKILGNDSPLANFELDFNSRLKFKLLMNLSMFICTQNQFFHGIKFSSRKCKVTYTVQYIRNIAHGLKDL